jgi:hypothetical protein
MAFEKYRARGERQNPEENEVDDRDHCRRSIVDYCREHDQQENESCKRENKNIRQVASVATDTDPEAICEIGRHALSMSYVPQKLLWTMASRLARDKRVDGQMRQTVSSGGLT